MLRNNSTDVISSPENLKNIRKNFGFNVNQFANFLGVHVASLYRWEKNQSRIYPMQMSLITAFDNIMRNYSEKEIEEIGEKLINSLVLRGNLFALYEFLKVVFMDKRVVHLGSGLNAQKN